MGSEGKPENGSVPQPISAPVMASVAKAQLLSPNTLHHLNLPELRSELWHGHTRNWRTWRLHKRSMVTSTGANESQIVWPILYLSPNITAKKKLAKTKSTIVEAIISDIFTSRNLAIFHQHANRSRKTRTWKTNIRHMIHGWSVILTSFGDAPLLGTYWY